MNPIYKLFHRILEATNMYQEDLVGVITKEQKQVALTEAYILTMNKINEEK